MAGVLGIASGGWTLIAGAVLAYLLGSIPFGLVLTYLAGAGDIRKVGSGNIGATNVLRTGRKGLAALTLLLDLGKGAAAVLLARPYGQEMMLVAAAAVLVGHMFPLWLRFQGGKGVATAGGVFFALSWPMGLAALGTWFAVAIVTRYSSLAALVTAVLAPIYAWLLADSPRALLVAGLALLVILRHCANIGRLLRGEESKIALSGGRIDRS
ncbi:MAG TPA: glycerol-3-phosphate 1-O-acyltransferase PlsY [Stellaceae bacterium]|nr:glycerol-3-phosphate 1-O-acyltransferase PlsY [Stellaceae bacterium]